jgi:O-antigen biosynthesis protein
MSPGVTAVVLSRDLPDLAHYCLKSLDRAIAAMEPTGLYRMVLVDNGSTLPYQSKGFCDLRVELVRLDQSWSWAAVSNLAISRYSNDLYFILNHHVILPEEALVQMVAFCHAETDAGLVAPRLMNPDGTICQAGLFMARHGPVMRARGLRLDSYRGSNQELQALSGTCLMVKAAVFDELGGFDDSTGLPDVDMCLRARQRGWRVFCLEETSALCLPSVSQACTKPAWSARRTFMRRWAGRYTLDLL